MGKYIEVFVAFDVAKKKHAVAIAEGGRTGEVRFLGDVENSPLPIERTIKRLAGRYDRLHICFEAGPTWSLHISPVRFDPLARPFRDQSRSDVGGTRRHQKPQ
jgi:hypothetical protein